MQEALEKRSVPLKFAYAGSAKHTHMRLASSSGYITSNWMIESELKLLTQLSHGEQWSILEFGPGDGVHSAAILQELRRTYQIVAYTGIDFSRSLFAQARPIIEKALGTAPIDFQCVDVELPFSVVPRASSEVKDMFLAIGSLLGNVDDPAQASKNIYNCLQPGTVGLFSVSAYVESKSAFEYIVPYETEVFKDAALEPLLSAGFPEDSIKLALSWDASLRAVIGTAVTTYPVSIQLAGKQLSFLSDEKINVFISRRFTKDELSATLIHSGFEICDIRFSNDLSRLDMLVRKPI